MTDQKRDFSERIEDRTETDTSGSPQGFLSIAHQPLHPLVFRHQWQKRYFKAFTLIELLVVTSIVGILAVIGVPMYQRYIDKNNNARAMAEIREIESNLVVFMVEHGAPPDTLDQVGSGNRMDPWGNPYQYLKILGVDENQIRGKWRKDRFMVPINSDFDLYSMGKDGRSVAPLTAKNSRDDIVRANNGAFLGLAQDY